MVLVDTAGLPLLSVQTWPHMLLTAFVMVIISAFLLTPCEWKGGTSSVSSFLCHPGVGSFSRFLPLLTECLLSTRP